METVSTEELEQKFENDEFVLIDVLSEEHFEDEHIKGAVNIPLDQIASTALDRFEKDQDVVVYCKDLDCSASPKAAKKLEKLGFEDVKDYEVGLEGWKGAGNDTEA